MSKRIALLVPAVLALAAGTALADTTPPAKGPFAGAVHASAGITYLDGSQQTWTVDGGRISSLSASSLTLTRRDKTQVTFTITSSTLVRNAGATYSLSDLKVGQAAQVVSQNGTADIIRNIRGDGAPSGGDPSAITGPLAKSVTGTVDATYVDGTGKSFEYDRGVITQADNGQVSVKRADGKQLSLTYSDSTIVRDCQGQHVDLAQGEGGDFFSQNGSIALAGCIHQLKRSL
jgi:hypothetical protein